MKKFVSLILAVLCGLVALGCDVTVVVFQIIESINRYGAIFDRVVVAHWSLWLLFGNLLFIPAYLFFIGGTK